MAPNLYDLVNKDLRGYKITTMTEVYDELDEGEVTIFLFRDKHIALAYADTKSTYRAEEVLVLTDGKVGYILPSPDPIMLHEDEAELLEFQKKQILH